jgi:hypothetical protein
MTPGIVVAIAANMYLVVMNSSQSKAHNLYSMYQ